MTSDAGPKLAVPPTARLALLRVARDMPKAEAGAALSLPCLFGSVKTEILPKPETVRGEFDSVLGVSSFMASRTEKDISLDVP